MFTKKEVVHLLISVFVLGLVFGFDDRNSSFVFGQWFTNFLGFILMVAVVVLFRELVIKIFARRHDAKSEYEIWGIGRIWFTQEGKLSKKMPFGIILAVILTLASSGRLFFTAIGSHKLEENKLARVGRKHSTINYFEEAQIISMGILSSLFLAVVGLIFGKIFNITVSDFVAVNFFIALFNMIPFSTLDGAKIFFGSLLMYIFILVFVIAAFLVIQFSIIFGLLIVFLLASIATGIYFYKWGQ